MKSLPADLDALASGGKAALARCLSAVEADPADPALAALLDAALAQPRGIVLGLTGPPGVGKSTLTNAFVAGLRRRGLTVGIVAVDPSSRRSGGALLGDRTRIDTDPDDGGVFLRSMAARQRLGGLADLTFPAIVLMRALFDVVFVETVGVGQSETEISDCSDLVVFCVQPASGDSLQFMKAGVMEVPDIFLVTKGDMGAAAQRAAADVKGALSLSDGDGPPPDVVVVSAIDATGIEEALDLFFRLAALRKQAGDLARRRARQSRVWIESRLRESFGTVGVAAVVSGIDGVDRPFRDYAELSKRAGAALQAVIKNI